MKFKPGKLSEGDLIHFYTSLLKPRMIEEKMLILLRQGKISKWFSGIGQEAVSVGAGLVMEPDEYILTMHRNLGVFTTRKVPFDRLFGQFQGKDTGFTKGRDRSFHFGTREHHIVGMISHLAAQIPVANGIALAELLNKSGKATLVFTGDGGTSEGDFHEALNVAAVWNLPVVIVIENNGYGLSTPSSQQFKIKSFVQKGPGYGIKALSCDGNNIIDVFNTLSKATKLARKKPQPVIVEAKTFRIRGHEEASGTKYVPEKLMKKWAAKDPIDNFHHYLMKNGILSEESVIKIRSDISEEIEEGLKKAYSMPLPAGGIAKETNDIFAPFEQRIKSPRNHKSNAKRLVDAVSDGLKQSLKKYDNLIFMGQDIAEYGGVFKISEGFLEEFGEDRIRNTPICESAILGMGLGLSVRGYKSVIEMQFADFVTCGFNQIANNLAKSNYRWGQNADVVIRMPTGAGVGAGPYHSQSNEAWFFHIPGLKIVYPSTPFQAKGLLNAAVEDPNPVLFFEHKALYRSINENIPDEYYTLPIGKGRTALEGQSLSIITYGMGVHWALEAAKNLGDGSLEVIDLLTLSPWDKEITKRSVAKTGRALVLHEDTLTGGIGAEIAAWISENCFDFLDAPVGRVGSLDTPVPFSAPLEKQFLASAQLPDKIQEVLNY